MRLPSIFDLRLTKIQFWASVPDEYQNLKMVLFLRNPQADQVPNEIFIKKKISLFYPLGDVKELANPKKCYEVVKIIKAPILKSPTSLFWAKRNI